jgi:hypothetical protein
MAKVQLETKKFCRGIYRIHHLETDTGQRPDPTLLVSFHMKA